MCLTPPTPSPSDFLTAWNILRQVVFFDELVRPHQPHQFFFAQDGPSVFNQSEERVESLRRERYNFIPGKQ